MKCIYTLLCFIALSAKSQVSDEPVRLLHYALDSFVSGKVLLKSGAISNQRLNYNLVTQEMIFEDHGTYLAIAHPENVDTVFLGSGKFVPVKNAFYEILTGTTYPLFIAYTCTVKEEGNATGYGNTTTGAATPIRSLETGGMSTLIASAWISAWTSRATATACPTTAPEIGSGWVTKGSNACGRIGHDLLGLSSTRLVHLHVRHRPSLISLKNTAAASAR